MLIRLFYCVVIQQFVALAIGGEQLGSWRLAIEVVAINFEVLVGEIGIAHKSFLPIEIYVVALHLHEFGSVLEINDLLAGDSVVPELECCIALVAHKEALGAGYVATIGFHAIYTPGKVG